MSAKAKSSHQTKFLKSRFFWVMVVPVILALSMYHRDVLLFFQHSYSQIVLEHLPENVRSQIWAHRVNSLAKALAVKQIFTGVELDIIYNDKGDYFEVNHPPIEAIDLRLDTYLNQLQDSHLSFWFDIKNLTTTNSFSIYKKINHLLQKYAIAKHRLIIESKSAEALVPFTQSGYTTSYYLPDTILQILQPLHKKAIRTDEKTLKELSAIRNLLQSNSSSHISCSASYYPIIKNILPDNKKLLLWAPELKIHHYTERKRIVSILEDESVDILLVGFHSKYDR